MTGVQTCALPVSGRIESERVRMVSAMARNDSFFWPVGAFANIFEAARAARPIRLRSTAISASDWTTLFIFSISYKDNPEPVFIPQIDKATRSNCAHGEPTVARRPLAT